MFVTITRLVALAQLVEPVINGPKFQVRVQIKLPNEPG
jgi:hypothetical protein